LGRRRYNTAGFFINDEDWALQPWAAKTFEPEVGNIGPKTYAKNVRTAAAAEGQYALARDA